MVATMLSILDPLIVKWIIEDGLQRRMWWVVVGVLRGLHHSSCRTTL
jgi:hypothetical protein